MTRPHVDFPAERQCPPEILRRLRAVDPTHDLVYMGEGIWMLGSVRPSSERRRKGAEILAEELNHDEVLQEPGKIKLARLLMQGFGCVAWYEQNEPDEAIVRDAGVREHNHQQNREAAFRANLAVSRGDERETERNSQLLDGLESVGGDVYRHAFQTPIISAPPSMHARSYSTRKAL